MAAIQRKCRVRWRGRIVSHFPYRLALIIERDDPEAVKTPAFFDAIPYHDAID